MKGMKVVLKCDSAKVIRPSILLLSLLFLGFRPASGQLAAEDISLVAPDGANVTIRRDDYGVPHITSSTETGVLFGQGFAVAQDRLFQLELHRRAAEGKLADWYTFLAFQSDIETRTMFYTEEERRAQFGQLPASLQILLQAYSDGINTYLDSISANPEKFTPEFDSRSLTERWTPYKSIAIIQYAARQFGQNGGNELQRLRELEENGREWFEANRPLNDLAAPTTIHGQVAITLPKFNYSGVRIRHDLIELLNLRQALLEENGARLGIGFKLGSFAALIGSQKSSSGGVMLLGAPQMGAPVQNEPQIAHEVELSCPTLHAGGMTMAGIPLVIIGRTELHAWSLTSGQSDNTDVFVDSTKDASYSQYFHNGRWLEFEVFTDTVRVTGFNDIHLTHYRTIHGPVFADDLANYQVYSRKMTFWNEELNMFRFIYGAITARNLPEFEDAVALNPMSFNVFYAGLDQNIKYWHAGKYQDRSDGIDPRLPHKGDGSEEWGGFIAFEDLPSADGNDQDYFVNWNNKPVSWWNNGDNIAWANNSNLTVRVKKMEDFVSPIEPFGFEDLKLIPRMIGEHGTYQQAIEFSQAGITDKNVLPPGQSGFISQSGIRNPHFDDQWALHANWQFKDMEFGDTVTGISAGQNPAEFVMHRNYPNPFNPETRISFEIPAAGRVVIKVFNIAGQEVRTLRRQELGPGRHTVLWDATDDIGQDAASGIYLYRVQFEHSGLTGKMLLLR
jgi:penicillin amidase